MGHDDDHLTDEPADGGDPAESVADATDGQTPAADANAQPPPRAYSYGTRDVQPGYESTAAQPPPPNDPAKSTRYDSPPDPRDPGNWGADDG